MGGASCFVIVLCDHCRVHVEGGSNCRRWWCASDVVVTAHRQCVSAEKANYNGPSRPKYMRKKNQIYAIPLEHLNNTLLSKMGTVS